MTIIRGLRGRVLYSTGRLGLEALPLIALLSLSLPTILLAQDFRGVIIITDGKGRNASSAKQFHRHHSRTPLAVPIILLGIL